MSNNPDSVAEELADDTKLLISSLGGPRGMFESGAPSLVFVATYALTKNNLQMSLQSGQYRCTVLHFAPVLTRFDLALKIDNNILEKQQTLYNQT